MKNIQLKCKENDHQAKMHNWNFTEDSQGESTAGGEIKNLILPRKYKDGLPLEAK